MDTRAAAKMVPADRDLELLLVEMEENAEKAKEAEQAPSSRRLHQASRGIRRSIQRIRDRSLVQQQHELCARTKRL
jgi:hypothetical protein